MSNNGKAFHRIVEVIERALCDDQHANVEISKRLPDQDTGRLREHDIIITHKNGHHKSVTAVECKDLSRKVGVPTIEGFAKKCEKTAIHRGIIVSSQGFAKTALEKAKALNIECYHMNQIESLNWFLMSSISLNKRCLLNNKISFFVDWPDEINDDINYYFKDELVTDDLLRSIAKSALEHVPYRGYYYKSKIRVHVSNISDFLICLSDRCLVPERVELDLWYEESIEDIPLKFHSYNELNTNIEPHTSVLTESATAEINLPNMTGELVFVRNSTENKLVYISKSIDVN